jgi:uncharacterized protein YuzE
MSTIYWLENLREREILYDLDMDGKIILERILAKYTGKLWTGCIWLRIDSNGGILSTS